jgi:hypothetical protein
MPALPRARASRCIPASTLAGRWATGDESLSLLAISGGSKSTYGEAIHPYRCNVQELGISCRLLSTTVSPTMDNIVC